LETVTPAQAGRQDAGLPAALVAAVCVAGVIALALSCAPDWSGAWQGLNDFPEFYLSPRLVGTNHLYDPAAFLAEQQRVLGCTNVNIQFLRLPYMAVLLAPLGRLPYSTAYALWQTFSIAALAAFAWLWPGRRWLAFIIVCWFPPVAANLVNAQDLAYVLLWVAISVALVQRGKHAGAGLVLALGAAKLHIFLFLPIVIVARRMWRLGAGLVAGAAFLLAVSFLAAGWAWPAAWLRTIRSPVVSQSVAKSSLLAFAAEAMHGPALWAVAGGLILLVGAVVYRAAQRNSFVFGLGVALAGGLIVAFHVYQQDYMLALPLILTLASGVLDRGKPERPAGSTVTASEGLPRVRATPLSRDSSRW